MIQKLRDLIQILDNATLGVGFYRSYLIPLGPSASVSCCEEASAQQGSTLSPSQLLQESHLSNRALSLALSPTPPDSAAVRKTDFVSPVDSLLCYLGPSPTLR